MYFQYGEKELEYLSKRDKKMEIAIKLFGKIEREAERDLFCALVKNIIGQQISNKAFETVFTKFQNYFKEITPKNINSTNVETIRKIGISLTKATYIKNIATKILTGELKTDEIKNLNDEEAANELMKLNGVGKWTAEMLLLFSLERKNIFSFGDFAIRKGLQNLHNCKKITKAIFEKYRKIYSPFASVASFYLWEIGNMNLKINLIASYVRKDDFLTQYDSPLGKIILASDGENLTGLFFANLNFKDNNLKIFQDTKKYLDAYFNNKKLPQPPKINLRCSSFQAKVLYELLKIPYGKTVFYNDIAKILKTSPRAVGGAIGKNPLPIIIPCHRVIGANNKPTGYAWGIDIKEKLINLERTGSF